MVLGLDKTPKEKALELALMFASSTDIIKPNTRSKEKAILYVEQIILTKPLEKDWDDCGSQGREIWYDDKIPYWEEVKKEIKLL